MSDLNHRLSVVPQLLPGLPPSGPGPTHFSLEGVPERERPAFFREFFGQEVIHYDIELLPDVPFDVDVRFQALPGLIMMWGRTHGSRNQRTRETLAIDANDDIGMIVNLGGDHRVAHGQKEMMLGVGEATILSLGEVWSSTHRPPGNILALRVPRAQFAPLVNGVDDCYFRPIPSATPALRLLTDYIRIAQGSDGTRSPELQSLVVSHVHDLMAVAVGATRDAAETARHRGLRSARLHAIKQDIAANLECGDLSIGALACRHGCTPRFVQRLFEAEGTTLTEYVLAQRLARAHRMLTDPRRAGEKISAIALDAGFGDVSYFNRAFRQLYGDTPSGVRVRRPGDTWRGQPQASGSA
jgi:AraC-like DNA-binding protein